ncbi:MAG: hypothetical protein HYV63_24175 [Candidatus Schekmanbacteria bacterium]|nr:hypothetical protein [Candidatus Schekmanbacteria bacterium]
MGFMFDGGDATEPNSANVIRHNVSENNGSETQEGGMLVTGGEASIEIYNNTVYTPSSVPVLMSAESDHGVGPFDVHLHNNVLISHRFPVVRALPGPYSGLRLENNAYFDVGEPPSYELDWMGEYFGPGDAEVIASWSALTGQEQVGGSPAHRTGDPVFIAPIGSGGQVFPAPLSELAAYRLQLTPPSPLVGAGMNLMIPPQSLDIGARDFFATPISWTVRCGPDIGAHQARMACP